MKKFLGKFLVFSVAIMAGLLGVFFTLASKNEIVGGGAVLAAESPTPSYFKAIYNGEEIPNGHAVLIDNADKFLKLSLIPNNLSATYPTYSDMISASITVNGAQIGRAHV